MLTVDVIGELDEYQPMQPWGTNSKRIQIALQDKRLFL